MPSAVTAFDIVQAAGIAFVILAIALLLSTSRRATQSNRRMPLGTMVSLLVLAGLSGLAHWQAISLVALYMAGLWLMVAAFQSYPGRALARRAYGLMTNHYVQACGLILAGFGVLFGWAAWHEGLIPEYSDAEQKASPDIAPPLRRHPQAALSDKGRPIPLGIPITREEIYSASEKRYLDQARAQYKVIRTAEASLDCNCYGWAFTGGNYWIGPDDVECVLLDNEYKPVDTPAPGDLIVYRTPGSNSITHVGVVAIVTLDGKVLIESKWGKFGCFLHRPEDQIYSESWTFYRSRRYGHLLKNLPASQGVL